ncbi:MAG: prepilin peptidase [Paracoccaceae bacterium]
MVQIGQFEALLYLPFVLPLCFYTAFTDMRDMKITNQTVLVLGGVFVILGVIALPLDAYLWRLVQLVCVLLTGIVLNAAGILGAGDAKFAAAAAPYISGSDLQLVSMILMATMLAAVATHRTVRMTPLRKLAPHWISWGKKNDFPMGLALAGALAIYLGLGAIVGA